MRYLIKAREIYTPNEILLDSVVLISGEKIIKIGAYADFAHLLSQGWPVLDLSQYRLLPGLVDAHIHGCAGFDTMDASYLALNEMSLYLARHGVTSFIATTVTSPLTKLEQALENVAVCMKLGLAGAKVLGSYVEGPYISKAYKGAHPEDLIRPIVFDEIESLWQRSQGTIKIFTLAPEKSNSEQAIRWLTKQGVKVSLGHSAATYSDTVNAIEAGARLAVHIFNGMQPLHHREAGLLGAALSRDEMKVELICDGIHVSAPALQIVDKCKAIEDIVLISDCIRAGGLADGEYTLGEQTVNVLQGVARIANGSLAGSTLKLRDAVVNMNKFTGKSLPDSIKMATINPARFLELDQDIGSLAIGRFADLIAVDDNFNVVLTMVNGRVIWGTEFLPKTIKSGSKFNS